VGDKLADKKYYFFKLKDDFFNMLEVKKLRKLAGGDTLTIIYLEMILESLKYGGKLYYEGVDETFESEMALKINENVENVSLTLAYLLKHGLIEKGMDETYALTQVESNILGETSSAERVRRCRAKKKALHCNTSVTGKEAQALPSNKIVNGDIELDIELDKDIELDIEKDKEIESNNKKKKKATGLDILIDSYTDNTELKETLRDFIKMRKSIKKPMTDKAMNLLTGKLDKLGSTDTEKIELLNQSILNSWCSVFPLKKESKEKEEEYSGRKIWDPNSLNL